MAEGDDEISRKDKQVNLIMLGVFGGLTLLCCCGGTVATGVLGADSESEGVKAALAASGPACCSVTGLLTVLVGTFALKGKTTLKIALPFAVGITAGLVAVLGTYVFFEVIWPSL